MKPEVACIEMHEQMSARLDNELDSDVARLVQDHLSACPACRRYEDSLRAVRRTMRTRPAEDVPDLTARVMERVEREVPRIRRRGEWRARFRIASLAAAAAALVLFGATLPTGERTGDIASASEIVSRVRAAARSLGSYTAEYRIVERGWHPDVPVRRFGAQVAFDAPESFSLSIRDLTNYPSREWPRNDVELVTNGDRWSIEETSGCPVEALPGCTTGGSERRAIVNRQPFDGTSALPTDLIVPLETIGASVGLVVLDEVTSGDRRAYRVRLPALQASPLISSLQAGGMWRSFHPLDPVTIDLDAETWFPLAFRIEAGRSQERAAWAERFGYADRPGETLFRATSMSFSDDVASTFDVAVSGITKDGGFSDRKRATGSVPSDVAGLRPYRSGRAGGVSIRTFVRGLAWLKIVHERSRGPTVRFLHSEELRLPGVGFGYFAPASLDAARRIDLFSADAHVSIESNLPRARMIEIASSMPMRTRPLPRTIHLAGGLRIERLDPEDVDRPLSIPGGYRVAGALRSVSRDDRSTLTMYLRREETEYDGFGIRIVETEPLSRLAPPAEEFVEVAVNGAAGRWSPERGELEWIDGDTYRSIGAPSFDLAEVLAMAEGLR